MIVTSKKYKTVYSMKNVIYNGCYTQAACAMVIRENLESHTAVTTKTAMQARVTRDVFSPTT
jgi:hypothetical protein